MTRKLSIPLDDEPNELVKRYEQFLEGRGPGYFDVEELETIVDFYLHKGKTKESSTAFELGFRLHPGNNSLQIKRAKIYLIADEVQKATRLLESVNDAGNYELILLKVEAFLKSGRNNEALSLSRNLFENEVDDIDNIALDLAYIFITQLNFEIALNFLKKGDAFNNKNIDLLFELAFCYEQMIEFTKAIETYNRIINIDAYASEAWFNLGQIYFSMQDFQNAIDAYDFVLTINPDDVLTSLQKAHAHFQLSQYDEALEAYNEYDKVAFDPFQSNLFIGECYEKMERFDDAILYYEKSLKLKPDNYDALTGIGICLLEKEMYVESLNYIRQALLLQADAPDAWVYLAEGLTGLDDLENALSAYLKSISLEPDQPDTLMAIANIYMDRNEHKTALEYYSSAYSLDNTLEYIDFLMAVAFYKLGDLASVKVHINKAFALSNDAKSLFLEVCPDADMSALID